MTNAHHNYRARRAALLFLLFLSVVTLPLWLTSYSLATRVAGVGGMVAAVGGLALLRPVMRLDKNPFWGLFLLEALEFYSSNPNLLHPEDRARLAKLRDADEMLADQSAIRSGALLTAVGTLINGFSGFLG